MKNPISFRKFFIGFLSSLLFVSTPLISQTFSPIDISGLSIWFTGDSTRLSGGFVDTVYDLSGMGNHADQLTLGERPLLVSSGLNGHKSIRFDGVDDYIQFNQITDIRTVFWVVKEDSSATANYRSLLSSNSTTYEFLRGAGKEIWSSSLASPLITSGITKLNSSQVNGTTTLLPPTFSMVSLVTTGNVRADNFSNDRYSARIFQGDLAELIIYNQALSALQVDTVEQYLRYKYAPPINLGADKIICSSAFPVTIKAKQSYYNNYSWMGGGASAIDSLVVTSPGSYYVKVQDVFGLYSSDTINVNLSDPLPFQLNDTSICPGGSLVWNTGLNNNLYTFIWQDSSTDSVFNITQSGQYYATITNLSGCSMTTDTVAITIDNFSSIASLGNDTSLCSGNSIYLKSGAPQATGYLWNDNSTNDSLIVTTTGPYWLTVTNANLCSKTDTINVTIAGNAPTANFSNTTTCFGNATTFTDLSMPPGGNTITNWLWNFDEPSSGVNDTSTLQDPIHIYADTGSYTVKLIVTTNAGCSAILSKIIRIYPYPQINFTNSNRCEDAVTQFFGQATTFGYPMTQWTWNFGDPASGLNNISSLQNPVHVYANSATYTVQLIAQNNYGCADTLNQNITINPPPVADFNYSSACKNSSVQFTDNSTLPPLTTIQTTTWNFGDNGTSTFLNPTHIFYSNVNYTVTHIITASNGCKDTAIKAIQVYPVPYAYFSTGIACENTVVDFTDLSVMSGGTITNWLWDFGSGDTSMIKNAKHIFTTAGNKNVKLTVTTSQGCKDSISQTIVVRSQPIVNFTFTPASGTAPMIVNFTNTSSGSLTYKWDFGGQSQTTMVNPSHTFLSPGNYSVSLIGRNNFGCETSVTKTINVLEDYIDVAITDIATSLQNNFLNLTATIVNTGNTDVTSMEFYINVKDGAVVKENWTGLLKAANIINYNLSSSAYLGSEKDYVCVSVLKPNGVDDEVSENNKLCEALDESEFKVLDLYPNPLSSDLLTIPFIIPVEKDLTITIYNVNGDIVKNAYSGYLSKGLQLVTINTLELTSGLYACKIEYENQTIIKTFLKN
ncbi:MAG: PKD domain-containing protein [Bacteroidota bacterium]